MHFSDTIPLNPQRINTLLSNAWKLVEAFHHAITDTIPYEEAISESKSIQIRTPDIKKNTPKWNNHAVRERDYSIWWNKKKYLKPGKSTITVKISAIGEDDSFLDLRFVKISGAKDLDGGTNDQLLKFEDPITWDIYAWNGNYSDEWKIDLMHNIGSKTYPAYTRSRHIIVHLAQNALDGEYINY